MFLILDGFDSLQDLDAALFNKYIKLNELLPKDSKININEEIALKWLNNGAMPTDTVKNLLSKAGVMKKFHDSKVSK